MSVQNEMIPLIGPSDGWPRTADGHLVKPRMTVWINRNGNLINEEVRSISANDSVLPTALFVVNIATGVQSAVAPTSCYAVKPEPLVTLESALRDFVESFDHGWAYTGASLCVPKPHIDKLLANARKALGETE